MLIAKRSEPRSGDVINEKGNIVRRNRCQLIPTNEKFEIDIDYENLLETNINESPGDCTNRVPQSEMNDNNEATSRVEYRTRSGRISKKPDRYGY